MLIILCLIFCVYILLGAFIVGIILDEDPIYNKNKKNLALLLCGPFGWIVCISQFLIDAFGPTAKNIINWFCKEDDD